MWMTHGQVHFSQLPRVVKDHEYMTHPSALILLFSWGTWGFSSEFSPDTIKFYTTNKFDTTNFIRQFILKQ